MGKRPTIRDSYARCSPAKTFTRLVPEQVSPITHLTKDDPPVLLSYASAIDAEITNPNIGIHHPLFGKILKTQMDELGIPCELYAGNKRIGGGTPMKTI